MWITTTTGWKMQLAIVVAMVGSILGAGYLLYAEGKRAGRQEVTIQWNAEKLAQAQKRESALQTISENNQKELDEARKREVALRKDVISSAAAVSGLRKQLQQANERITAASAEAVADYARTVNELFQDCSDAYRDVAEKADGHAADAVLLYQTFPTGEAR